MLLANERRGRKGERKEGLTFEPNCEIPHPPPPFVSEMHHDLLFLLRLVLPLLLP